MLQFAEREIQRLTPHSATMEPNKERSVIPLPSHDLAASLIRPNHIVGGMVESSLAVAKDLTSESKLDGLVREGKEIQDGEEMTAGNIRAFEFFYEAAISGHAEAQHQLSICYYSGRGIAKNEPKGCKWMLKAARSGFELAAMKAAAMMEHHLTLPANRLPREYFLRVFNEYKEAADEGDSAAQYLIGCFYRDGKGPVRNEQEAVAWLTRSADGGYLSALSDLGKYYESIYDFDEAYLWHWPAAVHGDPDAQHFIGQCYHVGCSSHVEIDLRHACAWYQLAEDNGREQSIGAAKELSMHLSVSERAEARALYREFKTKYSGRS